MAEKKPARPARRNKSRATAKPAAKPTPAASANDPKRPPKTVPTARPKAPPAAEADKADYLDAAAIHEEIARQSKLVPWIGGAWRWYDYPYRLLNLAHSKMGRRVLPRRFRVWANRQQNRLGAYNQVEREAISWPDEPMYNMFLPENEHVHLPKFFVLDFFSPSYASVLEKRVGSRRWQSGRAFVSHRDVQQEVKRSRERDLGGSWDRVAVFVPWDGDAWWPEAVRRKLPPEIRSIEVFHMPLGSALTAIVASFTLSKEASSSIDRVLRQDHPPRLYKHGRGRGVMQRMMAGIDDVQAERERIHAVGRDWLARELPGVFAAENSRRQPVLDILLTEEYDPFARVFGERGTKNYVRALGMGMDEFEEIVSPELPGFRLLGYRPERTRRDDRSKWVMVARLSDLKLRGTGKDDEPVTPASLAAELDTSLLSLFTRLGLFDLLDLKQRRGAVARDLAHDVHSRRAVTATKNLKKSVLRSSLDLAAIADDIASLGSDRRRYEHNVPVLHAQPGIWGLDRRTPEPLVEDLLLRWAARQVEDAAKLLEVDRALVRLLGVVATLTASVESMRAQRWSIFLGALSLIAATAAVWFSAQALGSSQPTTTPSPTVTVTVPPSPSATP